MDGDASQEMPHANGVFTTDAQLVVQSWNRWLEEHTGIPAATAVGASLQTLVPDLASRKLLPRFEQVLTQGVVVVLAPVFHHYLLRCPPASPSAYFDTMQQHVTIGPLRADEQIVGAIVVVEDMTARLDQERDLAAQLHHADQAVRLHAAQTVSTAEEHEPALLLDVLGDSEWRVRQAAVAGLSERAGADAVAEVLRAMRDEHHDLALLNGALQVLAQTDVDVVGPLCSFLRDQDTDLRIYAALALGDQSDPRAVTALIAALDDPDQNVRFHAIEALGNVRAAAAADSLLPIVAGGDFFLAFAAIDALRAIGDRRVAPKLVPFLADDLLRAAVAEALGALGDEAVVVPLLALLDAHDAPVTAIAQALTALYERYERLYDGQCIADLVGAQLMPTARSRLLSALESAAPNELPSLVTVLSWLAAPGVEPALARQLAQPTVRLAVIELLVRSGTGVTDLVIEQLGAEDPETRAAAVVALGRIGDQRVVPELIRLLETDPELYVVAADALAKIGDHRAFDALLQHIGDPDVAVRQAAISALNSLGHHDLEARSAELLRNPDPVIRESALRIAGYFGYRTCVDLIIQSVADYDEPVRQAAVEALPYLDDPRCLPLLLRVLRQDTPKIRAAAARALGHMDHAVVPDLVEALDDPYPWVRYFAIQSLGQYADPATLPHVVRVLETDPAGQVRIAAAQALGRIGGEQAAHSLALPATAPDTNLARTALHALGQTQHPAALPPLVAVLRADDPLRQIAAVEALAIHGGEGAVSALQWFAATNQSADMQQAAITALSQIQTPEATAALIDLMLDASLRETVRAVLIRRGAAAIAELQRALAHPHRVVRASVVEILAWIKGAAARDTVAIALDDADPMVRIAAITALKRLGHQPVARKLADLACADADEDVRRAAQTLVGQ